MKEDQSGVEERSDEPPSGSQERPIVFFDGVCNLCNAAVDFLIRHDQEERFLFASLQSDAASRILGSDGSDHAHLVSDEEGTLVLYEGGALYQRSTAALRIARHLPGAWKMLYAFIIVPRPIRDAIYRWIASNRYRWFGKKETCRLPTEAERERFLEA